MAAISIFGVVNPLPDGDWDELATEVAARLQLLERWCPKIDEVKVATSKELIGRMLQRTLAMKIRPTVQRPMKELDSAQKAPKATVVVVLSSIRRAPRKAPMGASYGRSRWR